MKYEKLLPELSMYEAARANVAGRKVNVAVSFYGKKYSFEEVFRLIDLLADNLAAEFSLKKGDTITLCAPNSPQALLAFYAANKLGVKVNLVHPYIPPEKLAESIERTGSRLLFVYDLYKGDASFFNVPVLVSNCGYFMGGAARIYYRLTNKRTMKGGLVFEKYLKDKGAPRTSPVRFGMEEPAVYLASGGTTGEPKIIAHNNFVFNNLCGKADEFLSEPLERYTALYNVLPIFHGFGLCINMHMCMMMRATNIMCIKFNARMSAKQIIREKANILTGVPTMFLKLLGEKTFTEGDLSNLKDVYVGGDSVPDSLVREFNAALSAGGSTAKMYIGYGLTETVTVCLVNTLRHNCPSSIGYPLSNTEVRIYKDGARLPAGEVGEIYLHTDQFMLGYLGEEHAPFAEEDGKKWLKTGDYGWLNEDGFLFFKQRIKNMIKVSGVPVYPSEIEEAVLAVPGVKKACAVGKDDAVRGQVVKLFVEIDESADEHALSAEIQKICREKLIAYAVPRQIVFRGKLPVNLIGKIDRKKLEEEK